MQPKVPLDYTVLHSRVASREDIVEIRDSYTASRIPECYREHCSEQHFNQRVRYPMVSTIE